MKILVTGGIGFIGSNLVPKLRKNGHEVHVLDNQSPNQAAHVNSHNVWGEYSFTYGSVTNENDFPHDENYDLIYHLAAMSRVAPSFEMVVTNYIVNSSGTINVLEYAKKQTKPPKVIYAGSSCSYHDVHANPYAYTKWLGEEHCKLYTKLFNVQTAIARFFNIYGPNQIMEGRFATVIGIFEKQTIEGKPLTITGTGHQRRDFLHVNDLCDGLMRLGDRMLETGRRPIQADIYNFGTGRNHSINEVAKMFQAESVEYLPGRQGEAQETLADISKAKEDLGWEPEMKLEEYVSDFVAWARLGRKIGKTFTT